MDELKVALRYEGGDDDIGDFLPETQSGAVVPYGLSDIRRRLLNICMESLKTTMSGTFGRHSSALSSDWNPPDREGCRQRPPFGVLHEDY